jgi:hypothetical protein
MPDFLYDFQQDLTAWAIEKGRAAIFADCGLGKTPMQLVWAQNVVEKTNGRVLLLAPFAVGNQTKREADKFGIYTSVVRDGKLGGPGIYISNYERLHYFDNQDFDGVVCDESSILKNFDGVTKAAVTEFMRMHKYRLLCTATAAPNDSIELGTSSEALGEMGFSDVLSRFFRKVKKTYTRRDEHRGQVYQLRPHALRDFWRWVCSWSRAIRNPSDLGYDNGAFKLPPLITNQHIVTSSTRPEGYLFDVPAIGLHEQRKERRRTLTERCEKVAELVSITGKPAVCWCNLNDEGNLMEKIIPDAVQIAGKDSDDRKVQVLEDFAAGKIRVLVTKSVLTGFGLNWQHCSHQTFFPSHSFEQWYQSVRRSWRFGQKNPVTIDVVTSEGESEVLANLNRKQVAADEMFSELVSEMKNSLNITATPYGGAVQEIPSWM